MHQYAIEHEIPIEDTLVETHSRNTYQNMQFSKYLMDEQRPNGYHVIFATNNYHTFRASLYTKQVGLNAQGISSKTAGYFLPNTMIREYMALLIMNKKRHIMVTLGFLLFGLLLAFTSEVITQLSIFLFITYPHFKKMFHMELFGFVDNSLFLANTLDF